MQRGRRARFLDPGCAPSSSLAVRRARDRRRDRAVFFDVDFTLIYPGPTFRGEGYRRFCARHGMARRRVAVRGCRGAGAAPILDAAQDDIYDAGIFHRYTARSSRRWAAPGRASDVRRRDLRRVGGAPPLRPVRRCAGRAARDRGARASGSGSSRTAIGRSTSFQSHFELDGLISAAVSSSDHGYMKPHPSIFNAALQLIGVQAGESVMVGDSLGQDIDGALGVGMRAVLVRRGPADQPFPGNADQFRRRPGDSHSARAASAALTRMLDVGRPGRSLPDAPDRTRESVWTPSPTAPNLSHASSLDLTTLDEFRKVEELEGLIWGRVDLVPVVILAVSVRRGAVLVGAWDDDQLVGFVYSFPALRRGEAGASHWSHMLGVHPDQRGAGLGRALKLAQRERVLALGLDLIEWTFDPLQAANAHLNFVKLGVVVEEYEENVYGESPARCTAACRRIASSASGGSAGRTSSGVSTPPA